MRYIVKKSAVPLPAINGAIVDTWNVEDEVNNAPSLRIVKEVFEAINTILIDINGEDVSTTEETTEEG